MAKKKKAVKPAPPRGGLKKKKPAKKKKTARRPDLRRETQGQAKRKKAPKLWKPAEVKLLRKLFSTTPTSEIAKELRRKTDAVKKKASRMGLRKSKKYLRSIGRA